MNRRSFLSTVAAASATPAVVLPAAAETSGPLLPLLREYERSTHAFNTCGLNEGQEYDRLESIFSAAADALEEEAFTRGTNAKSLVEAQIATRIAVSEYVGGHDLLSAGLALAALGYFLGEEAVNGEARREPA